jgi:hypothetical protein
MSSRLGAKRLQGWDGMPERAGRVNLTASGLTIDVSEDQCQHTHRRQTRTTSFDTRLALWTQRVGIRAATKRRQAMIATEDTMTSGQISVEAFASLRARLTSTLYL